MPKEFDNFIFLIENQFVLSDYSEKLYEIHYEKYLLEFT
jgi:hypothetical protein